MKIIKFVIISLVTIGAIYIYMIFNGNPIYKHTLTKEAKLYLKEKYTDEMVVNGVYYDTMNSNGINDLTSYNIYASLKDNPKEVYFLVRKSNKNEFTDRFLISLWEKEAELKLNKYITKLYSKISYRPEMCQIEAYISENYDGEYLKFAKAKDIELNFKEMRNKLFKEVHIKVHTDMNFNKEQESKEYDRIFKIIDFIEKQGYKSTSIFIKFNNMVINMNEDKKFELNKIKSPNDIKKYIKIQK
jgi:predicted RNase H-related nuclease YkuK (DUF458 family)